MLLFTGINYSAWRKCSEETVYGVPSQVNGMSSCLYVIPIVPIKVSGGGKGEKEGREEGKMQ
jgi:hypothetical protein